MIAWTIYITFAGAALLLVLPRVLARWIALLATVAALGLDFITFIRTPIAELSHFATIVRVPRSAATRAIAREPSSVSGPSSMPARTWQCRSITPARTLRQRGAAPVGTGMITARCIGLDIGEEDHVQLDRGGNGWL